MANYDDIFKAPVERKSEQRPQRRTGNNPNWAAEQKAAREDAYALADSTAAAICEDGRRFRDYLDVQSRFIHYSATNALLILAQQPQATRLRDKTGWAEQNYSIREGEKPISIIKPGKSFQREDESYGTYYNVRDVYDISQTDAPQAQEPTVNYDERILLSALIAKRPVPIELVDDLQGGGAVYDHAQGKIFMQRGMDAPDIFRSLSLALSRAEMAQKDQNYTNEGAAFKSYCASYVLGKKYGIDVSGYDFSRLPEELRTADDKERRAVLNEIRDTVKTISGRMERAMEQNKGRGNREER